MNKAELIAAVAAAAEISKKDAETAVSATLDAITAALKEGDKDKDHAVVHRIFLQFFTLFLLYRHIAAIARKIL